eukprot:6117357-Prymnesium_polylepis.1
MSHNRVTGNVPEFGECFDLRELRLSHNELSGDVPSSLGKLVKLAALDLSHNLIKGELINFSPAPTSLESATKLLVGVHKADLAERAKEQEEKAQQ